MISFEPMASFDQLCHSNSLPNRRNRIIMCLRIICVSECVSDIFELEKRLN